MSGRRRLSDAQIDEMASLRERGWGVANIARHFTEAGTPISAGAIGWQCLRVGADAPPRLRGKSSQPSSPFVRGKHLVRPYSSEEDARLREFDRQGVTVAEMGRRLDRKENSIRGRLLTLTRRDTRAEEAAGA